MTAIAPERPALDPTPIGNEIDAILATVRSGDINQVEASEKIDTILSVYADEIETAGGGEHGDSDMWDWSERVRWAAIPDGYEGFSTEDYINEFPDALVHLWEDPRSDEEDGAGE